MKLIIDIPEDLYDGIECRNPELETEYVCNELMKAVDSGTPLDDVKAEIVEEICLTDNPYTKETKYTIEHLKLLEILDNIGKAESEEGT